MSPADQRHWIVRELDREAIRRKIARRVLAEQAGLSHGQVQRLLAGENKRPDLDAIERLAGALGLELDLLPATDKRSRRKKK